MKALFFGHTHAYRRWEEKGIHLVNLPALGYSFNKKQPLGWVKATVGIDGMQLELRSLDRNHPEHDKKHFLRWRAPARKLKKM